ncbi:hypothetical protein C8R43DRAFT_1123527 [Mycena crocata]|nr:hypothetical protein C8R43DRAFT_1123527 [Mycena crocata]
MLRQGKAKCSDAQLDALSRYREKHAEALKAKARERMARRRELVRHDPELLAQYQARARMHSAHHRAEKPYMRQWAQRQYRARQHIKKHGYDAWYASYIKRQPAETPPESRATSQQPESTSQQRPTSRTPSEQPDSRSASPPRETEIDTTGLSESEKYQAQINAWLDNDDPTTAPDYVPKPGQERFFQRGKWRWY